jgi:hypothetical protein
MPTALKVVLTVGLGADHEASVCILHEANVSCHGSNFH